MAGLISKPGPVFSMGRLFKIPGGTNPTPRQYALIKSISLTHTREIKEMISENVYPEFGFKAGGTLSGEFEIQEDTYRDMLTGTTGAASAVGSKLLAYKEAFSIPATPGPYTYTTTHAADFSKNLGVVVASTGKSLTRVASGPATGEYSVDETTGVYTFAAADQAIACLVTYEYDSATGTTVTVSQSVCEASDTDHESLLVYNTTLGVQRGYYLPRVVIPDLPVGLALKEFAGYKFKFNAYPLQTTGKILDKWESA